MAYSSTIVHGQGNDMTTTVTFTLSLPGDTEPLPEAELKEASGRIDAELDFENVDGAVVITAGDQALEVEDELSATISGLCFGGVASLLDEPDRPFLHRFAYQTAHIVMIPMMDSVRIFGEQTPVVTVDRDNLLPALYDCGLRYVKFLESHTDHWAGYAAETLRSRAELTRRALTAHGLPA
jgi:hypothetical protein